MPTSPVLELHKEDGAAVVEAHGWRLLMVYSSVAEEYRAATEGVGLLDRSYVGRLKLGGQDALDLLNRLSTNKLDDMTAVGQGIYTVLTSNKGRVMDLLFVSRLDDHLLVLTGPENRRKVMAWIDFYTFAEDIAVEDVTERTSMLAVMGPRATRLLDDLTGRRVSSLASYGSLSATIDGADVLVMRTDFAGPPGYDLALPTSRVPQLWNRMLDLGAEHGLRPVGMDALEVVRVEHGVPAHGRELTEEVNPLEANLRDFVSFNKGCYIGQEVVARLNTYKKVQRHLVGLSWDGEHILEPGASLEAEGKGVGVVTSAVRSLRLSKAIGLGYVRKAHAAPGAHLTMTSEKGDVAVRVEELPFRP